MTNCNLSKLFSFYFSGDGTLSVCNLRSNKVAYLVLSLFILAFFCMQSVDWLSLHLIFSCSYFYTDFDDLCIYSLKVELIFSMLILDPNSIRVLGR